MIVEGPQGQIEERKDQTFDQAGATEMYCEGAGIMEMEAAFLKSLPQVRSLEMKMGNLNLLDEAGAVVMTLKPADVAP